MNIFLNGQSINLECRTIHELLEIQNLVGQRIAVERNGAIVAKGLHHATPIEPGDRIEIVVAVGGG